MFLFCFYATSFRESSCGMTAVVDVYTCVYVCVGGEGRALWSWMSTTLKSLHRAKLYPPPLWAQWHSCPAPSHSGAWSLVHGQWPPSRHSPGRSGWRCDRASPQTTQRNRQAANCLPGKSSTVHGKVINLHHFQQSKIIFNTPHSIPMASDHFTSPAIALNI